MYTFYLYECGRQVDYVLVKTLIFHRNSSECEENKEHNTIKNRTTSPRERGAIVTKVELRVNILQKSGR